MSTLQIRQTLHRLASLIPVALPIDGKEKLRASLGVALGVLLTAWIGMYWAVSHSNGNLWLAAPVTASAIIVFALPGSPLAQPWPVIAGNTLSALVGVAFARSGLDAPVAVTGAVTISMVLMFTLRCLHPPGGAVAVLAVLSSTRDFAFALSPVLLNSLSLIFISLIYNRTTGRRYPMRHPKPHQRFTPADLDLALKHFNQVVDISQEDLGEILHFAESAVYQRKLGELRCADVMSREPVSVRPELETRQARRLMQDRLIKALPVVSQNGSLVGIITLADLVRARDSKAMAVGDIMSAPVQSALQSQSLLELMPVFANKGHHHIPILDERRQLVGIITQTDLVRALVRAVSPD